jgi:hypothetical protein
LSTHGLLPSLDQLQELRQFVGVPGKSETAEECLINEMRSMLNERKEGVPIQPRTYGIDCYPSSVVKEWLRNRSHRNQLKLISNRSNDSRTLPSKAKPHFGRCPAGSQAVYLYSVQGKNTREENRKSALLQFFQEHPRDLLIYSHAPHRTIEVLNRVTTLPKINKIKQ